MRKLLSFFFRHEPRDRRHWLPVQQRVQFKLRLLMFKALHGLALTYLADLCQPVASVGSRSAIRGDLVISPTVIPGDISAT